MSSSLKTWAPLFLPVILCAFFAFKLLPERVATAESALNMELPLQSNIPNWWGEKRSETKEERAVLSQDTEFSKADYFKEDGIFIRQRASVPVHISFVLSGKDMNGSIHRPERCLPSQGHYDMQGDNETITITPPDKTTRTIPFKILKTKQMLKTPGGKEIILFSLHYYVFIGNKETSNNHLQRLYFDIRDRVLLGQEQRWAYAHFSTFYGENTPYTEKQAQSLIKELIQEIFNRNVNWDLIP